MSKRHLKGVKNIAKITVEGESIAEIKEALEKVTVEEEEEVEEEEVEEEEEAEEEAEEL